MSAVRQPELDMVRGTAIMLVLGFHFRLAFGLPILDAALQPVLAIGWAGVDLFFVLSGFLVGRLILGEVAASGTLDRGRFFLRRAWRLWPVLWLYCIVLLMSGGARGWAMIWPVLLHVQNYGMQSPDHLWSLAVEEHFYVGSACLLPAVFRRNGHRGVEGIVLTIMVLCLLLRLGALLAGVPLRHLQWQTQYRLDAPAFGVLLASVSLRRPMWFAISAGRRWGWFAVAVAGAGLLGVAGDGPFRHGPGFTIAYLAAGAFIISLYGAAIPARLTWPATCLAALGLIAYPLYVWHASIGAVVRALGLAPPLAFAGACLAAIGFALLIHRVFERPLMQWSRRDTGAAIGPNAIAIHYR